METSNSPHPIRARFRAEREKQYTCTEAAAKIGITVQGYASFENRSGAPQMALVYRRARILGLDIEAIKG